MSRPDHRIDHRPAGHRIVGDEGTLLAAPHTLVLVDAAPTSSAVAAIEPLVFTPQLAADELVDAIAARLDDGASDGDGGAVAVVTMTVDGRSLATRGDVVVTGTPDGEQQLALWLTPPDRPDDVAAILDAPADPGPWVVCGVVAAGGVVVGHLDASAEQHPGDPVQRAVPADRPTAAPDESLDLGNLVTARSEPVVATTDAAADAASDAAASDATAAFEPAEHLRRGHLVGAGGEPTPLDAPIVVGRRPPTEPIAGITPHVIVVDDRELSRHHATFRVVDTSLVVVDERSTNGTFLVPDTSGGGRRRCPPGRPVEVPVGASVELGAIARFTHRGADAGC